ELMYDCDLMVFSGFMDRYKSRDNVSEIYNIDKVGETQRIYENFPLKHSLSGDYIKFNFDKEGIYILGRGKNVDFKLNHSAISRKHAEFNYKDNKLYIKDLSSSNGIIVNDVLLKKDEEHELTVGDIIKTGGIEMQLT
nr:FHA domain-containing protein [Lachnospiraceae bacterium]